jgi:hypothetical protein
LSWTAVRSRSGYLDRDEIRASERVVLRDVRRTVEREDRLRIEARPSRACGAAQLDQSTSVAGASFADQARGELSGAFGRALRAEALHGGVHAFEEQHEMIG